jgi:hypothetical protein
MVGRIGTTATSPTYLDVQAWKVVTDGGIPGNDGLSVPVAGRSRAPFVSDTDLRIVAGTTTGIESGAVPIASLGLPNRDFDQTIRPALGGQAPDMGAFEFTGVALSDVFQPRIDSVQVNPRADQCVTTARNITVFARDNTLGRGIDSVWLNYTLDSIAQPRVLLTRSSGTAINGVWTGILPAAPGAGRTLRAEVVARDSAANSSRTVNIGTFRDDNIGINAGNDTTIVQGDSVTLRATTFGSVGSTPVAASRAGGNGAGGITFNVRAIQAVTLDSIHIPLYGTVGSAANLDIWYRTTPINGSPTVSTAGGWIQLATGLPAIVGNSGTTSTVQSVIPIPGGLTLPSGAHYGFFVGGASTVYTTWAIGNVDTFTDGRIVIYTGQNIGYGGPAPNPTNHPRQFNGSVSYRRDARPIWTVAGSSAVVQTGDSLRVAPSATTTYVATVTDSICFKRDSVVVSVNIPSINDISMEQILSPTAVTQLNQPYAVRVVLRNNGNVAASNFDVAFRVVGGPEINANPVTRTIQPNDTIHYTFTQAWTPSTGGDLRLSAYVRWTDDVNSANDTAFAQFTGVSVQEVNDLLKKVYPNPADQLVMFDFGSMEGAGTLEIRDQLGRLVHTQIVDLSVGTQHQVRTADFAAGVYNYRFVLHSKVQYGQLVIKR